MNELKSYKIDEVSNYVNRGVSPTYVESSGIIIINQKCIRNGKIDFSFSKLTSTNKKYTNEKKIIEDDILINSTGVGTAGRVSIFKHNFDCYVDTHVSILRLNNQKAYPKYVFYNLFNRENEIENYAEGSTGQIELGRDKIKDIDILLPSLPEQKAIASVLSSLDDKIDLLHRQNETLEKMAETLFRKWFVEDAKEDWESKSLGSIFDIGIGRTPPRKEHHWFSESKSDIKWVSIKDMGTSGMYISNVSEYLTMDAVNNFSIPIIPENTVILSFKMTIGRLAITTEKMLSNEAIAHFKIKKGSNLYSEFLYLFLKSYQWEQLGSTSSIVESINSNMIKEMEIIIPEEKLLNSFKEIIEPYFQKIKSNQLHIQTLTTMRDTLLPKLMSGEVRVKLD